MSLLKTTDNLVSEVRSLTNELNQDSLETQRDILPALNRAQDQMMNILSKHYPEPYIVEARFPITGKNFYEIPEDAWSDNVTKIEILDSSEYRHEVHRAKYRDVSKFRTGSSAVYPDYYVIHGRKVELIPKTSGSYTLVMWYVRNPEQLVLPQGRITLVDEANNRIKVDSFGDDLSTESDELESWINIVDGQTGEVKVTCQIKDLQGTQDIILKSITDDTILNRTVTKDISLALDEDSNLLVKKNDYICSVAGTCVPYFFQPGRNFIISHAAADCSRSIGGPSESMYIERNNFEKEIQSAWVGREASLRKKNVSPHWTRSRLVGKRP